MKFFIYDNANECVILNKEGLLLTKEFNALMERSENKKDKSKDRAFREFTYMFLFFDWESPYFNEQEQERHLRAMDSSQLTDLEFEDALFKAACIKYNEVQNSSKSMSLLRAAMMAVDTLIYYLQHIDVNERSPVDGKPIFKAKDLIGEIKNCKDVIISLQELEKQVKAELEPDSGLRGGVEAGFYD